MVRTNYYRKWLFILTGFFIFSTGLALSGADLNQLMAQTIETHFPANELERKAEKFFYQGNYAEALVLLNQLLESEERIHWLRLQAESHQYLGHMDTAEVILKKALQKYPYQPEILEGLGWLALFQGEFKRAEYWLLQASELDRDSFWIQLNLAYAWLFQGRENEAFRQLCQLGASPEGPSLGTVLKRDFAKFRKFKLTHPASEQLSEQFTSHCGLGLVLPEDCFSWGQTLVQN
jgi:tetratricopeptide (TPR) repeat protein